MIRRLHVPELSAGVVTLDPRQSHHARDVLRLDVGLDVELFDDAGNVARASILSLTPSVTLQVSELRPASNTRLRWTVASAVPKGSRADWMIEKLSELGAARFVPLATTRAVVLPEGQGKRARWQRLAEESAKQSRRSGVMQIDELTDLKTLVAQNAAPGWFFATSPGAVSIRQALDVLPTDCVELLLLIGPEGGWTDVEEQIMRQQGLTPVSLGATILRVETAALAAGAIVGALAGGLPGLDFNGS